MILDRGRTAAGRVVDEDGRGILGARISVRRDGSDLTGTQTDAEGRFLVHQLSAGRVELSVQAAGFTAVEVPGVEIEDGPGPIDLGTVVLARGARIDGRVTDPGGTGLTGAEIRLRAPRLPVVEVARHRHRP